jgi:hypothetical protein
MVYLITHKPFEKEALFVTGEGFDFEVNIGKVFGMLLLF